MLAEFIEKSVNVIADMVSLCLGVGHHLVPIFPSFADTARPGVPLNQFVRVAGETLDLIGDPSPGVWTSLGGKDHPEREANGSARDGTPNPNLRSIPL